MSNELSTGKTIFILAVVVGCFAVLWPRVFYPMLAASVKSSPSPAPHWRDAANSHHLVQLCFLLEEQRDPLAGLERWTDEDCLKQVKKVCGVVLTERILEGFRLEKDKTNLTNCLRFRYDLTPQKVSATAPPPTRTKPYQPHPTSQQHARPERSPHLQPEELHPALREKGRAMPQRTIEKEARPGPMPGVRPPMGGGSHMVPPQSKGSGAMGIIMPLYTVGIVIFFIYTIMKILFKKNTEDEKTPKLKDFHLDPEYRKYVFAEEYLDSANASHRDLMRRNEKEASRQRRRQETTPPDTKIEDEQMDQLRRRLEDTEKAMERLMSQMGSVTDKLTAAKITEVLTQAQAQAKMLKMGLDHTLCSSNSESAAVPSSYPALSSLTSDIISIPKEAGDRTSDDDLTSSEAFTNNTLSEDYPLPLALQRHLQELQVKDQYLKGTTAGSVVLPTHTKVTTLAGFEAAGETTETVKTTPLYATNGVSYVTPFIKDVEVKSTEKEGHIKSTEREYSENLEKEATQEHERQIQIASEREKKKEISSAESKCKEHISALAFNKTTEAQSLPQKVAEVVTAVNEAKETKWPLQMEDREAKSLGKDTTKETRRSVQGNINVDTDAPEPSRVPYKDVNRQILEAKMKAELSSPSDIAFCDDDDSEDRSNASATGAEVSELKSFADEGYLPSANNVPLPVLKEQIVPEVTYIVPEISMPAIATGTGQEVLVSCPVGVDHGTQTDVEQKLSVLNFGTTYEIDKQRDKRGIDIYEVEDKVNEIILDATLPPDTQLLVKEAQIGSNPVANIEIDASEIDNEPCVLTSQVSLAFVGLEHNQPEGPMTIIIPEKRFPIQGSQCEDQHALCKQEKYTELTTECSSIAQQQFEALHQEKSTDKAENQLATTDHARDTAVIHEKEKEIHQLNENTKSNQDTELIVGNQAPLTKNSLPEIMKPTSRTSSLASDNRVDTDKVLESVKPQKQTTDSFLHSHKSEFSAMNKERENFKEETELLPSDVPHSSEFHYNTDTTTEQRFTQPDMQKDMTEEDKGNRKMEGSFLLQHQHSAGAEVMCPTVDNSRKSLDMKMDTQTSDTSCEVTGDSTFITEDKYLKDIFSDISTDIIFTDRQLRAQHPGNDTATQPEGANNILLLTGCSTVQSPLEQKLSIYSTDTEQELQIGSETTQPLDFTAREIPPPSNEIPPSIPFASEVPTYFPNDISPSLPYEVPTSLPSEISTSVASEINRYLSSTESSSVPGEVTNDSPVSSNICPSYPSETFSFISREGPISLPTEIPLFPPNENISSLPSEPFSSPLSSEVSSFIPSEVLPSPFNEDSPLIQSKIPLSIPSKIPPSLSSEAYISLPSEAAESETTPTDSGNYELVGYPMEFGLETISNPDIFREINKIAEELVKTMTSEALDKFSTLSPVEIRNIYEHTLSQTNKTGLEEELSHNWSCHTQQFPNKPLTDISVSASGDVSSAKQSELASSRGSGDTCPKEELWLTTEHGPSSRESPEPHSENSASDRRFAVVSSEHANGLPTVDPSEETMAVLRVEPVIIRRKGPHPSRSSTEPSSEREEEAALMASKGLIQTDKRSASTPEQTEEHLEAEAKG